MKKLIVNLSIMLLLLVVFACTKNTTNPQTKTEGVSYANINNSTLRVLDREWDKDLGDCVQQAGTCLPVFTVEEEVSVAFNEFVNAVSGNEADVCSYFSSSYWEDIFASISTEELEDLRSCDYDLIEVQGRAEGVRFFFAGTTPVTDSTFEFVIPVDVSRLP